MEHSKSPVIERIKKQLDTDESRRLRISSWLSTLNEALHYDKDNEQNQDYAGLSLINFNCLNQHLLIAPIKCEMVTDAGIVLLKRPDQETLIDKRTAVSNYFGMIVSAAPDAKMFDKDKQKQFVAGDICIYAKHRETFIEFGTKLLTMVSMFDVWGVIPDNLYYNFQFDAYGDAYQQTRYKIKSAQQQKEEEFKK